MSLITKLTLSSIRYCYIEYCVHPAVFSIVIYKYIIYSILIYIKIKIHLYEQRCKLEKKHKEINTTINYRSQHRNHCIRRKLP